MSEQDDVLTAVTRRAEALARRDGPELLSLLHPQFVWTSHTGELFDRDRYVDANVGGSIVWLRQDITDTNVCVVADTAVVRCRVTDVVNTGVGLRAFVMPVTQTWLRNDQGWLCLAGHAGPLISTDSDPPAT